MAASEETICTRAAPRASWCTNSTGTARPSTGSRVPSRPCGQTETQTSAPADASAAISTPPHRPGMAVPNTHANARKPCTTAIATSSASALSRPAKNNPPPTTIAKARPPSRLSSAYSAPRPVRGAAAVSVTAAIVADPGRRGAVRRAPHLCGQAGGRHGAPGYSVGDLKGSAARLAESPDPEASVELILLTRAVQPTAEVLPALGLLPHQVTVLPQDAGVLVDRTLGDALLVDARRDLISARAFVRVLAAMGTSVPILAVLTEGGLIAMSAEWPVDDFVLDTAGPAELDARLRLAVERRAATSTEVGGRVEIGELVIDEATYAARLSGVALDLTYKEFELLKFLAQHPGRVFTRSHLVQEVWGYDYFGGTRTVDVHVRRLRAKLGVEYEGMIGTVRNVGYKFVRPADARRDAEPVPVD